MRNEQVRPVVFISAENEKYDSEWNGVLTRRLGEELKELFPTKEVTGCYKGTVETSYMVGVRQKDIATLLDIAERYEQESILFRDANKDCQLLFVRGQGERLGQMVKVDESVAKELENYTYDDETGDYYAIKPRSAK